MSRKAIFVIAWIAWCHGVSVASAKRGDEDEPQNIFAAASSSHVRRPGVHQSSGTNIFMNEQQQNTGFIVSAGKGRYKGSNSYYDCERGGGGGGGYGGSGSSSKGGGSGKHKHRELKGKKSGKDKSGEESRGRTYYESPTCYYEWFPVGPVAAPLFDTLSPSDGLATFSPSQVGGSLTSDPTFAPTTAPTVAPSGTGAEVQSAKPSVSDTSFPSSSALPSSKPSLTVDADPT